MTVGGNSRLFENLLRPDPLFDSKLEYFQTLYEHIIEAIDRCQDVLVRYASPRRSQQQPQTVSTVSIVYLNLGKYQEINANSRKLHDKIVSILRGDVLPVEKLFEGSDIKLPWLTSHR